MLITNLIKQKEMIISKIHKTQENRKQHKEKKKTGNALAKNWKNDFLKMYIKAIVFIQAHKITNKNHDQW